jgi:hypothetical protein
MLNFVASVSVTRYNYLTGAMALRGRKSMEFANTNSVLLPAATSVAALCDASIAAAVIAMVGHCRLSPIAVTYAAADTLRAMAGAVHNPASAALGALAAAIQADGCNRRDQEIEAKRPGWHEAEELDALAEKATAIYDLLVALRDNPASATRSGHISLANAL